jgi:hypothetical protein
MVTWPPCSLPSSPPPSSPSSSTSSSGHAWERPCEALGARRGDPCGRPSWSRDKPFWAGTRPAPTDSLFVLGLALANGLVALSGSLLAQYQGFTDIQMGIGMLVVGIASTVVGGVLVGTGSLGLSLAGVVIGSLLFRLLVSIALGAGLDPNYLKLITAVFLLAVLVLPHLFKGRQRAHFLPGTPNEVQALDGISLTVPESQFVSIIGGNGSGKGLLYVRSRGNQPSYRPSPAAFRWIMARSGWADVTSPA